MPALKNLSKFQNTASLLDEKQILTDLKKKTFKAWHFFCKTCKGSWCNYRMQNESLSKLKTIQREVMLLYFIKKSFAENPKLLRLRQAWRSNFKSNGDKLSTVIMNTRQ